MFKTMRLRITMTFVLLVLLFEVIAGTFVTLKTVGSYHSSFERLLNETFTEDMRNTLTYAANTVLEDTLPADVSGLAIDTSSSAAAESIKHILLASPMFKTNFMLDFAIMDGNGEIQSSSMEHELFKDSRIAKEGIAGVEGTYNRFFGSKIEYALPIKNGDNVQFVIYICDFMEAHTALVKHLIYTFLILLPLTAITAFIFGNIFSRSVASPLKLLADKATKLADGDTSALTPSQSNDEIGELTNALLYLSNSKREHADEAMSEKTRLEAILQNMSDGIMAFDKNGKLTHINPEAMKLLNRNFVDDITFNNFFKEINANITLESLQYMPSKETVEREVTINNHTLQFSFAFVSKSSADNCVIVIIHDITKHEKLERSRREFVANVSHELRTPITVIKSYADILADTPDSDPQTRTRFLNTISSETDRMAKIISDLLTLSSLDENANFPHASEEIDVRSMLEGLVERLKLTAKKKEQRLIYTPMNDVPKIKGDRDALERVFTNIISNAMKYTPTGGEIQVFSSCMYNDIVVKVSDTGIGISSEQLPNIFDRFYRVDKARSRDKGGTGLGLAIAKQTIENVFHGKIVITSELNKGTDVSISIPIPKK